MIGIVFEHPTWLEPLFSALAERQIPYQKIDLSRFSYDTANDAILPLYVNRLSASSYQRDHQRAIAIAFSYFKFLAAQGATVLNACEKPHLLRRAPPKLVCTSWMLATISSMPPGSSSG